MPHEQKALINISQVIDYILAELPASDRATVKWPDSREPIWVLAASYRVLFALESMLGYLLRSRAGTSEISLEVDSSNSKYVEIVLTGLVRSVEPNGDLEKLVEAMRTEIALGERVIGQIARECGGAFKRQRQTDEIERLSLRLKLARH